MDVAVSTSTEITVRELTYHRSLHIALAAVVDTEKVNYTGKCNVKVQGQSKGFRKIFM